MTCARGIPRSTCQRKVGAIILPLRRGCSCQMKSRYFYSGVSHKSVYKTRIGKITVKLQFRLHLLYVKRIVGISGGMQRQDIAQTCLQIAYFHRFERALGFQFHIKRIATRQHRCVFFKRRHKGIYVGHTDTGIHIHVDRSLRFEFHKCERDIGISSDVGIKCGYIKILKRQTGGIYINTPLAAYNLQTAAFLRLKTRDRQSYSR